MKINVVSTRLTIASASSILANTFKRHGTGKIDLSINNLPELNDNSPIVNSVLLRARVSTLSV